MRVFFMVFCAAALAGSLVIGAQPDEDQADETSAKSKANPGKASDDDPADSASEDDETPAAKPAKKENKRGVAVKLTADDEAELVKTLSYMQGFRNGREIHRSLIQEYGVDLDIDTMVAAFRAGLEGKEPSMTEEEMHEMGPRLQKFIEEKYTAKRKEQAAVNKEEGTAFLAANKKKEGVKTLPSGLQYKILKSGKGESPKKTDTAKVHYKGTLISGEEFDSSYKRGQPAPFPVGQLVPGMTEALLLMKVGDKWQIVIPPALAYGAEGRPGAIPPNATLIFEVELLGVEKGSKQPTNLK
ncbi:MAG TPA: FKBP-type peptidyl-prolyl cis-trans isomerase [Pirellulales bacterium]|nr:FKBP-type peptidyl-prolyl cis-trans isomerase [Pirellulales bacterium]